MRFVARAATASLLFLLAPAAAAQTPVEPPTPAPGDSLEATVLPVRSVREVVALDPAFRRDLATGTLVFRSRAGGLGGVEEPVFVVDGVRRLGGPLGASTLSLLGAPDVPFAAVRSVEALGGFVPASIGEAGGGIVAVTTAAGAERFGGRVEGFSSALTDAFNASLASATVRGPLGRRAGFSITGEARRTGDAVPSAGRSLRLPDEAYARFDATPQAILIRDASGVRAVPLPVLASGQPFTEADLRAALGLGTTGQIENPNPISAADAVTEADVERVRAQDDPLTDLALTGQISAFLPGLGRLRGGGSLFRREMSATAPTPDEAFARRFANRDGLSRQTADRASAFLAAERIALPGGVEASARASFETTGSLLRPAAFSDDVADALRYGDADDDVFAAAQRYVVFSNGRYVPQYGNDGATGISRQPITGFARPGTPAVLYDRQSASSTQAAARLERTFGAHRVELGGEVEAQTFRRFTLDALYLATYANDGNGQPVPGFPNGVDAYEQLDFETLRLAVETYGYSFNGLERTDGESVAAYFPDPVTGERRSTSIAPFRPLTAAGYVRDQLRLGPVEIDAGLRVERYDARATTLFDPFATVAVQRAGALPSTPAGIGGDFAVYYADNGATLVGFRDREGQFYDADGTLVGSDVILQERRGAVRLIPGTVEELFEPTRAVTRLQPRIGVRVQASRTVVVTGYAMRASRRPAPSLFVPFSAYDQLSSQSSLPGSAALGPEDVRAAGAGVRVAVTPRVAIGVEAFARQTRGIPESTRFNGGLPAYVGARSTGRTDEVGVDVNARLAPVEGVAVMAGYTGARPSEAGTRHAIDVAAEARTPASAGLLGNIGLGVVVQAQSGLPYTALQANDRFSVFDPFTPNISGEVDGSRLPWTVQADVRLERRVALGAGSVTAFVWVENVLGTRNALAVYRATGQPDDDGFATTPNGQQVLDTPGRQLLYADYIGGPVNVGGRQSTGAPFVYGQPRQVRLGVVLGL